MKEGERAPEGEKLHSIFCLKDEDFDPEGWATNGPIMFAKAIRKICHIPTSESLSTLKPRKCQQAIGIPGGFNHQVYSYFSSFSPILNILSCFCGIPDKITVA